MICDIMLTPNPSSQKLKINWKKNENEKERKIK